MKVFNLNVLKLGTLKLKYVKFFFFVSVILTLFFATAFIGIYKRTNGFKQDHIDITQDALIAVYQTAPNFPLEMGSSKNNINDNNVLTWWYGSVDDKSPNWVEFTWKTQKVIDAISINFGGGRYAVDYKIQHGTELHGMIGLQ